MEDKKTLRDVPREYFGKFSIPSHKDPGQFWGMMLCFLLFLILSAAFFNNEHPVMKYTTGVIFILAGLYFLPSIFFSSKKRVLRYPKTVIVCNFISMEIMCLIILNLITAANYMYCDSLFDSPVPRLMAYIVGGLIYVQHIVMIVLFWKRIKKCIIDGCYLPEGTGFWTEKLLPKVMFISAVMPTVYSIAISFNTCSIASDCSITLTEGIYPFVALIFLLLAEILSALMAYGNANVIGQYNFVKIYGGDEDCAAQDTEK